MELKALTLTNFRVFKEETEIPFSPLTIITGANSSGKSSVFKALMLLQESLKEKDNNLARLNFTSGEHVLGTFNSIRNYTCSKEENITFKLTFENNRSERFWASVKDFIVTLEYCQDKINPLNGELIRLQIDVKEKKETFDNKRLLLVERLIEDTTKVKLDIDLAWLISNSMQNEKVDFFKVKEDKIRDNVNFEVFAQELTNSIKSLEKQLIFNLKEIGNNIREKYTTEEIDDISSRNFYIDEREKEIIKLQTDRTQQINNIKIKFEEKNQAIVQDKERAVEMMVSKIQDTELNPLEKEIGLLNFQINSLNDKIESLREYQNLPKVIEKKRSEKRFLRLFFLDSNRNI